MRLARGSRTRPGASILHCDRDALHAAAPPFTAVQKRCITYTVGGAQAKFIRMKSTSKKRTPSIVNLTVKRRYLTEREVERLMDCARKYGRYGHRDATMILVAYRHGLRASEVCDLQWQQIELPEGRLHVHRVKNGISSVHPIRGDEMRALRKLRREYPEDAHVFVSERCSSDNSLIRLRCSTWCSRGTSSARIFSRESRRSCVVANGRRVLARHRRSSSRCAIYSGQADVRSHASRPGSAGRPAGGERGRSRQKGAGGGRPVSDGSGPPLSPISSSRARDS